jgi:hypothetical protein
MTDKFSSLFDDSISWGTQKAREFGIGSIIFGRDS